MRKEVILALCLILVVSSASFVSASWLGDFWNKLTGKAISTPEGISSPNCEQLWNTILLSWLLNCSSSSYNKIADIDSNKFIDFGDFSLFSPNKDNEKWCSKQLGRADDPCNPPPVVGEKCNYLLGNLLILRLF